MKKLLLILLCLPMIGFGQQTYVPDSLFEAYLEAHAMGNGIADDNYVTTANINTVTSLELLYVQSLVGMSDMTGIEGFAALEYLNIGDWTGSYLSVTNLDVSQNTALAVLSCSYNERTSLNISGATSLTSMGCNFNQLTSLDVSNNLALIGVDCSNNQIECLDVSNNTVLENLVCNDNLLEQLNTRNGNWQNLDVNALNNNLTCVEVDNIGIATNDWDFDSFTTITTNCNYTNPCNTSTSLQEHTINKELLKVTDLLGRETKGAKNEVLFYIYDDGTVEKRIVIE